MKKWFSLTIVLLLLLILSTVCLARYNESPMLKELVGKGEIPPVDERLPKNPLVIKSVKEIGQYGGNLRTVVYNSDCFSYYCYEPLIKLNPLTLEYEPNIAMDWEVSKDKRIYTFKLLKGIKWSDGVEFTSEDILFWYEDIIKNDELFPAKPGWMMTKGELGVVTVPDKWTVIFTFKHPNPYFLNTITEVWKGKSIFKYPKHYLKQFHPKYTDKEKLAKLVKEEDFESWYQLLPKKASEGDNPKLPTLNPWILQSDSKKNIRTAVRNPYYFKVDPEGNQLPYLDYFTFHINLDSEIKLMKTFNGELDYCEYGVKDIAVIKENEKNGNYYVKLVNTDSLSGSYPVLYVEQCYQGDKEMAQLLENVQFRKALSVAINRDEINEFVNYGLAEPHQSTLCIKHPAGKEEYIKAYTEYNPQLANKWLDEIGLNKRDKDGYRLFPSGNELLLIISPYETQGIHVDTAEIIKKNFELVGLKTIVRPEPGNLWMVNVQSGKHQFSVYQSPAGMYPISQPQYYFPVQVIGPYWASAIGRYYSSGGKCGIAPTGLQKKLLDIYEAAAFEPDDEKRLELVKEAMKLHADNLWMIGTTSRPPKVIVYANKLNNTPEEVVLLPALPAFIYPEQYYMTE